MFAVIAPALMTGACRPHDVHPPPFFIALWVHLVYFPFCHWVWGGGFLAEWDVADFAGGIVVHISAGFSALAVVAALPHRKKIDPEPHTDHNIPFVALGTGLLCSAGSASTAAPRSTLICWLPTAPSTPRSPPRARSSRGW